MHKYARYVMKLGENSQRNGPQKQGASTVMESRESKISIQ
jgi:hypothetical protein